MPTKKDRHVELVRQWVAERDKREKYQWQQLWHLKNEPATWVDATASKAHNKVFAAIDCKRCANCCYKIGPAFRPYEINDFAQSLGLTTDSLIEQYLKWDPTESIYEARSKPCPFLGEDQLCTVYEHRPESCRQYPHTDSSDFANSRYMHANNSAVCPAVYHVIEELIEARKNKKAEEKFERMLLKLHEYEKEIGLASDNSLSSEPSPPPVS
jgi:Fe-S-cluster containining protein